MSDMEQPNVRSSSRNPDWSRDETILLLDLYLSAPRAGKNHPEVVALSTLLRAAGRRDDRAIVGSFRNPAGIAMRLRNLGRHDPDAPLNRNAGLRPGGAIDHQIWSELGDDRQALAAEVERIRRSISSAHWQSIARSSRGPTPSFGVRTTVTEDGRTSVYLLLIDGPLDILAPGAVADPRWIVIKVGRTSNLDRRMAELAAGLPPNAAIRYVPIGLRMFSSAHKAHAFERHVLDLCDYNGWSLGAEFAYVPLDEVRRRFSGSKQRTG